MNNEAHREVEYIVRIEQKIESIGSDFRKGKITLEDAVESHKIPVDAINNFIVLPSQKRKQKVGKTTHKL